MTPDIFISKLYRDASFIPLEEFSSWALDLLRQVIHFDAAIWGTGHISSQQFHTQTTLDVPPEIFEKLRKTVAINPIFKQLMLNEGLAVDMREILTDEEFYQSSLYLDCFKPYEIERILSSIDIEFRSGIFTLLTLYRFDRNATFSYEEKRLHNQLLFHLRCALSHKQFITLNENTLDAKNDNKCALCDREGIYHNVTSSFLDVLEAHLPNSAKQQFPLTMTDLSNDFTIANLQFKRESFGELFKLTVRVKNQLDELTQREREVVEGICKGSTFKQIAKSLNLSPSTVSNHLYRIYSKLGINKRSDLVALVSKSEPAQ
ncbi:response regulator transcription factor [Thalassotalea piscium]|uniref:RNA polymerase sigma factor (Sigma-70 family) n=1 Tax=Thalassotalea piscium TaxID=1230533 RepID=A0A7X0NFG3_9GAMM|nr:helix-turn-helix transcriptional regulator [Thalassotalea piscium]MBB6542469.1 RNA polymerase sigma factor (sigma-70 family) [Thalassotalea piscium]